MSVWPSRLADWHIWPGDLQNRQRLSVKSKAQVIAASSPAATAVSTTLVLKRCELSFGDTVKAVGESDLFGSWDSSKAPELQWQEGHDWQANIDVPAGDCSFKVVQFSSNTVFAAAAWNYSEMLQS